MLKAISLFLGALGKISHYKLWPLFLIIMFLLLIVFLAVFGGVYVLGDYLGSYLSSLIKASSYQGYIGIAMEWGVRFSLWFVAFITYKYIMLILLSPVFSLLSSKVESSITGKSTSSFTFIAELVRGVRFNVRNIWKELLFTVLCLILGFIPVINLTVPFILFVIQSYYLGMGIMDYYMERHFTIGAALTYIDQHKFFVTGIGGCFILTMLIPVIGWVFAPILATIACTEYGCNTVNG
jgi:CysZ protein